MKSGRKTASKGSKGGRKPAAKARVTAKAKAKKKPTRTAIMRHSREGMRRPRESGGSGAEAKRAYLDRLRAEVPTTLKVMRALPEGSADFQPHEKSKTALQLVHTFSVENWGAILGTKGDLPMPPRFPAAPPTLEEAIANYERGAKDLAAAVEAMPDSRLSETVNFFTGPGQMGRIPVMDLFWYLLMDSIHHRGQLSVYVRLAGGKVPSIYGPTADEPWR